MMRLRLRDPWYFLFGWTLADIIFPASWWSRPIAERLAADFEIAFFVLGLMIVAGFNHFTTSQWPIPPHLED